ncbi:ASCH domain-containing protein [Bdellovibrio sp. HCB290]|uniref:ASCH domain-containing protein n=1 Tax=Bdellovibrio sp. HCB290 TaxID=3394356 RepID=UPI0039B4F1CF
MTHTESVKKMWQKYHDSIGVPAPSEIVADFFSDNEKEATELAILVDQGIKQATASALWSFEKTGSQIPAVGGIFLVVDGRGEAVCIVKTTKVSIIPFNEISEANAFREGEGDRSLEYWRRVHVAYYKRQFEPMNLTFEESMPIVFEEFEKVFP